MGTTPDNSPFMPLQFQGKDAIRRARTPLAASTRKRARADDHQGFTNEESKALTTASSIRPEPEAQQQEETKSRREAVLDAQIGEYEVGRLIGSGMIGVVAIARHHQTKHIVVLKCMSCDKIIEKNLMQNVKSEIDIHYELSREPFILPLTKVIVR